MEVTEEAKAFADAEAALERLTQSWQSERLSSPFAIRITTCLIGSAFSGFLLGAAHGATETGYRFRAENAHRLPTTQAGWFLYHKSKNYHSMLGGIKDGGRLAGRFCIWTSLFFIMEEATDGARAGLLRLRKGETASQEVSKDFFSTVLAGLSTAGVFSLWNRFPLATAARVAKTGAKAGLLFGLTQDAIGLVRGRRLGYVEFIKRHTIGQTPETEETHSTAGLVG